MNAVRGVLVAAAVCALLTGDPASAAAPGLTISVPPPASFGSQSILAGSFSASLGTVTVSTSSTLIGDASWVATVSTSGFSAGPGQSIPAGNVSYSAGLPTGRTGFAVNACLPGSGALATAREAYRCTGPSVLGGTSLSWNPTITITLPATATVGMYSGTITHSVA